MKLNKLIIPVACILLAGNASMAQVIMPWENRTETDGDPFAKGETTATKGKLHLEEIIGGRLIQTKGIGAMTWMKDGERYSRMEPNAETGGMDIVAYRAKDNRKVSEKAAFFFCYAARLLSIFIFKISLVFSIITFREVILQK